MKGKFNAQLAVLRADDSFLQRCEKLYANGYKDWHILSAIFNRLMHLEGLRRGIDLGTKEGQELYQTLQDQVNDVTFPASVFDGSEWEMSFTMHAITCLATYGFEPRTAVMHPDLAVKFLRERMRHFELDIPHQPMFENPLGDWPNV